MVVFAARAEKNESQFRAGGIWKAVVLSNVEGEFQNYDPLGLIAGALIKVDCSINWRHQNGKRYCFASGTSLIFFLKQPNTNIHKAYEIWRKNRPHK